MISIAPGTDQPTDQRSSITDVLEAAARRMYEAEIALHAARQSQVAPGSRPPMNVAPRDRRARRRAHRCRTLGRPGAPPGCGRRSAWSRG
jgi:hypothetical protein